MQVSQVENMDTHAVIGGNDVQSFGISNNAEFYTLLSDSLYSDKIMAVVREIMCNAWDSHLVSDKKDIPIEITISDNRLTIRDFGTGIPNDQVRQIYCIYGESTKKKSKLETGGFGLGSKAPFAYTEHFTVSNWHNGTKTVYAISRGSVETQGKPDIRTIVSVPDDNIGIEVSMPIKERDIERFDQLIRYIAHFGGMNVKFQNDKLNVVNYDDMEENFIIVRRPDEIETYSNIFIKYGSVVYPVVLKTEYTEQYVFIEQSIKRKPGSYVYDRDSNIIIFNADPNTITVTPSRESLEYSETTMNTLTGIMDNFYSEMNKYVELSFKELVKIQCDYCIKNGYYSHIFNSLITGKFKYSLNCFKEFNEKNLTSYKELAKYIALHSKDNNYLYTYYKTILNTFLDYLFKNDKKHTETYRCIRKYINRKYSLDVDHNSHGYVVNEIINKHIIKYFKELLPNHHYSIKVLQDDYTSRTQLISSNEFSYISNRFSFKNFLINVDKILLAKSLYAVQETTNISGQLVIKPHLTKKSIDSIKEDISYCKYTVDDVLNIVRKKDHSSDNPLTIKTKPKGFVRLSDCLSTTKTKYFRSSALDDEGNFDRILEPKHVVYQQCNYGDYCITNWGDDNFDLLLDRYPDTVVLRNKVSYDAWIKKGAVDTASLVIQEIHDYIEKKGNKFLDKLDLSKFMDTGLYNKPYLDTIELIASSKSLQSKLKIKPIRNKKEKLYSEFIYHIYKKYSNSNYATLDYVYGFKDYFDRLNIKADNDVLLNKLKESPLLNLVSKTKLTNAINESSSKNHDTAKKLLNILIKDL